MAVFHNGKKLKVALELSGLTRCLYYSWLFVDKYLKGPLEADVFLHTWKEDHGGARTKFFDGQDAPSVPDQPKEDYIKESIIPIEYRIESQADLGLNAAATKIGASTLPMYYSIQQANLMKKRREESLGFVYDLVIRARMDCFFEVPISMKEIAHCLENDSHVFVGCYMKEENYPHDFPSDCFAFSTSKVMDIYCNTFDFFKKNPHLICEAPLEQQLLKNKISHSYSSVRFKMIGTWREGVVQIVTNEHL
jgi:hypothetical protein